MAGGAGPSTLGGTTSVEAIELTARVLRQNAHLLAHEPDVLASRFHHVLVLTAGADDIAAVLLARARHALDGRTWLRLVNHPPMAHAADESARGVEHGGAIHAVAWSPDSRLLATAGEGPLVVWDAASGRRRATLGEGRAPRSAVRAVAWSPDGTRIAWCRDDGPAVISAAPGETPDQVVTPGTTGWALAWSPDGRRLALGQDEPAPADAPGSTASMGGVSIQMPTSGGGVRVWDRRTRVLGPRLAGPSGQVHALAWSPDGRRLAAASTNAVPVWDMEDESLLAQGEHDFPVVDVAWSPDGKHLAYAGLDLQVVVVDVETWECAWHGPLSSGPFALAWSPDGSVLAAGLGDGTVWLSLGDSERSVEAQSQPIHAVAFSPDGRWLASGAPDGTGHLFPVPELLAPAGPGGGAEPAGGAGPVGHVINVNAVAWSPDGGVLASAGMDSTVLLWSAPDGEPTGRLDHGGPVTAVAWDGTGAGLATGRLDIETGEETAGEVRRRGAVCLWDARAGRSTAAFTGVPEMIRALAWSVDGARVAAAVADGSLWVLDVGTGGLHAVLGARDGEALSVSWAPDGRTAVGTAGGAVWVVDGHGVASELPPGVGGPVHALAFAPDGAALAVGTSGGVRILPTPTATTWRDLLPHAGDVQAVAWSSDGALLAAGDTSGAVRVWDVGSGRCEAVAWARSPIGAIRFGDDGTSLHVGDTGAASMHRPIVSEFSLEGGPGRAATGLGTSGTVVRSRRAPR